jgi:signal transduction histidine kinase
MTDDPISDPRGDILVVDDTPANLKLLSQMLTEHGYQVRAALDGVWALTTAQAAPPDLIVLDILMPEMDGYEVCRRVKADPRLRDIPVLFISALGEVEDKVKGFAVGGVDYITKPFQLEEVLARIQTHLALRTLRRQLQAANADLEHRVDERTTELRAANKRLTDLNRLKDDFVSRISHELRTPLTSIKIYLELLDRGKPEKRAKYFEILQREAERLQVLIEDLLKITQLSTQSFELEMEAADLNSLLANRLTAWSELAARRGLEFQVDLADDLPPVLVDRELIVPVFAQLIKNAIDYTVRGTIHLSTVMNRYDDQRWVMARVADTGPGIAPDELQLIFERFYRGRAAADYKTPGTGVGLAISQEILTRLNGRLTVESEVGHGSTFIVWLPVAPG